ncbi:site-specific DNA-methyltransferase [Candidatus Peregrinibacteria bacterium]|nr:site-specific DNA-methyltransferase [Candidatus Peregrinibacteria bacterium]
MTGQSANPQAKLLSKLMREMPEIFSEGKIDSKKLKATLGEDAVTDQERYGLTWAGKTECFKKIQETTTNTLKPCRDESIDFDKTENFFIEGDNLQVLKILQKSYYGKVKMIYIDPPYNTGNDFIYNDKFSRTKREELIANGSIDDDGNVVNHDLYRQNTRDSGHFHSNWLNMMYPRIFLARNLLRQDGVIFVSIDDNEVKNLRAMMDEIFGEENFLATLIWKRRASSALADNNVSTDHEYVVCYQRGSFTGFSGNEKEFLNYKNPDNDPRGDWVLGDLTVGMTASMRPNQAYDLVNPKTGKSYPCNPNRVWAYIPSSMEKLIKEDSIYFPEDISKRPMMKRFKNGLKNSFNPFSSLMKEVGLNTEATKEMQATMDGKVFEYAKPLSLLRTVIKQVTTGDDIVFDFFAGSGTVAHAVMQLNAEDGGNRKWICVQLPEKCKEESDAAKAGFVTIADIAKERIRRAGKKVEESLADKELSKAMKFIPDTEQRKPDIGFKVFKLDESNFKVWNMQIANVAQLEQQLLDFVDNVRSESTTEDMLYELILKSGLELNIAIEEKQADGGKYHRIGDGSLIICLADKLTKPLFEAILKDKPEKIITLDRAFANNDQLKTNMMLEADHAGIKEFKVI